MVEAVDTGGEPAQAVKATAALARVDALASASLSVVAMFNGYDDFPLRMSFFQITESFSHVA